MVLETPEVMSVGSRSDGDRRICPSHSLELLGVLGEGL